MVKISKTHHRTKDGVVKKNPTPSSFDPNIVLQQLGGNRFIAMTGARNFVYSNKDKYVGFRLGRNHRNINYVRITLNANDLYDVEFMRIRKFEAKTVTKVTDVYGDQLRRVFEEETGMATSLGF